ncbi:hypothetical protein QSJ19_02925 [Gordonia sp. ABSL11-1]|uniref:HAD family hydrolase n=1 Tax=Gordonia sp. ABSL11-1 TaxID=3053924 RepID=UPI0025724185|nr:hypothetical protein [Gordonia sp. ABSL11-1]MDL9944554.1 hypothetical protein [Gordonia sp. ABSL11-1]
MDSGDAINNIARDLGALLQLADVSTYRELLSAAGVQFVDPMKLTTIRDFHRLSLLCRAPTLGVVEGLQEIMAGVKIDQVLVTAGHADTFAIAAGPEIVRHFVEIAGCDAAEKFDLIGRFSEGAIAITDSVVDAARFQQARVPFIGVTWGLDDWESLKEAGAISVCRSAGELRKVLLSLDIVDET